EQQKYLNQLVLISSSFFGDRCYNSNVGKWAVNLYPQLAYLRLRLLRERFLFCCNFFTLEWMSKPTFTIPNTEAIIATTSLFISITLPPFYLLHTL
ncbi:hypothetical protein, partial [Bacillus cereus]|uniref:hypothetical protein n=1 Tax=Bacillus cereus TaxID=1396 RepID=UPI0019D53645